MTQKNIRLPQHLWDRIEAAAGKGHVTDFIRKAAEAQLAPIETEQRLRSLESAVAELRQP